MVAHGNGSLDYVKITARSSNEPPEPVAASDSPPYCKCGNCREMAKDIENKCCDKVTCHRNHQLFVKYCTDVDNLQQSIRERSDIRAERVDYSMSSLRKAAYRQYVLWQFGKLGQGNRRVVPSCLVLAIRHKFPSENGLYMGFMES